MPYMWAVGASVQPARVVGWDTGLQRVGIGTAARYRVAVSVSVVYGPTYGYLGSGNGWHGYGYVGAAGDRGHPNRCGHVVA